MPITTTMFPALTDHLDNIFNEVAKSKVSKMIGPDIFNVKDTTKLNYDHLILHGLGMPERLVQGSDIPMVSTEEGDSITWVQKEYGKGYAVTKKMRKFDLYDQIDQLGASLPTGAFAAIEQSMADSILYGWANSYTDVFGESGVSGLGPDGIMLFNASHSNNINSNVFSNVIVDGSTSNPTLSRSAVIAARKAGLVYKDPNGLIRPINLDTLLVAPSKQDLAERMLYSTQMAGTGNNDIEPLKGQVKLKVWPQLETRSDSTDTSAYWFMYDSEQVKETLHAKFSEKPSLDAPEKVYRSKNWEYTCDFYYTLGLGYPAYIRGSNASESA